MKMPKAKDPTIELRTAVVAKRGKTAIERARTGAAAKPPRATMLISFPADINAGALRRVRAQAGAYFDNLPGTTDARLIDSPGFLGVDVGTTLSDEQLRD